MDKNCQGERVNREHLLSLIVFNSVNWKSKYFNAEYRILTEANSKRLQGIKEKCVAHIVCTLSLATYSIN